MKITVLVENSPGPSAELEPEFGLSLLIEAGNRKILLDTGASGRFAVNAQKLNFNLESVDLLVLSHGHYDHGGGLQTFFECNSSAKAIVRKGADRSFFGTLLPGLPDLLHQTGVATRYIGLEKRVVERYAERIHWIDDNLEPFPGVRIVTRIPRTHALARGNRYLLEQKEGRYFADDFSHELLLVVEEENGAVVFSGCAHNGILNMVEAASNDKPGRPIRSVIGGFHLNLPRSERMSATEMEIKDLALELGRQVTGTIYTGHCTGSEAFKTMKTVLGERLQALCTGIQFEV